MEELLLQIQTLTTEKAIEEELRSLMQLERVGTRRLAIGLQAPYAGLQFRSHRSSKYWTWQQT